jgi:hypothetical protein
MSLGVHRPRLTKEGKATHLIFNLPLHVGEIGTSLDLAGIDCSRSTEVELLSRAVELHSNMFTHSMGHLHSANLNHSVGPMVTGLSCTLQ